jgi:hypothetical protein
MELADGGHRHCQAQSEGGDAVTIAVTIVLLLLLLVPLQAWAAPPPRLTFTAQPTSVTAGSVTTLSWTSKRTETCAASEGWTGSRPTSGSEPRFGLDETTSFTLTCTGPSGRTVTVRVTVTVIELPPPPAPPASVLTLTWDDMADNENGFVVERVTSGAWAVIATLGVNSVTYQDGPLTPGVTYCYRVAAFNWEGQSYSNEACGVAP